MQAYSNPKRANDPHALPDVEVFYIRENTGAGRLWEDEAHIVEAGWYWWACFPGCLPDSDPIGPFATEAEALADAQADSDEDA